MKLTDKIVSHTKSQEQKSWDHTSLNCPLLKLFITRFVYDFEMTRIRPGTFTRYSTVFIAVSMDTRYRVTFA